jgi:exodeoxyribonuclease V alpha subunit
VTNIVFQLAQRGVISSLDSHLAMSLGRIGGEDDPSVLLGAALASRAPRHGHICVVLNEVSNQIDLEDLRDGLQWPVPEEWLAALKASPLVRDRHSTHTTPLVLDRGRLYLDRYWRYQQRLAGQLLERARHTTEDLDPALLRQGLDTIFPARPGTPLSRQRLACLVSVLRRLSLVTGGPGTGKTYTVASILALLVEQHAAQSPDSPLRIALAAPTGKAADRMSESIEKALDPRRMSAATIAALQGLQPLTLHKLLGWQPRSPTRFRHSAERPLPHDVVVIDEASMVDLAMMSKLVDAVRPEARLILLGDADQLASVEAGAVLGDLCIGLDAERPLLSSEFAATLDEIGGMDLQAHCTLCEEPGIWDAMVRLTQTHRYDESKGIGRLAAAVREGHASQALAEIASESHPNLALHAPAPDSVLFDEPLPEALLQSIVAAYIPAIQAAREGQARLALDALNKLRVMTALRDGPLGLKALNQYLARALAEAIPGLHPGSAPWLGQPILIRENDAHLELRNGQAGILVAGEIGTTGLAAAFPQGTDGVRKIGISRLPRYDSMLCMTIHQSQGSQFEHAVLILPSQSSRVLTRELVYTGITRAEERVSILSTAEILAEAIERPVQRASGLPAELWHTLAPPPILSEIT